MHFNTPNSKSDFLTITPYCFGSRVDATTFGPIERISSTMYKSISVIISIIVIVVIIVNTS